MACFTICKRFNWPAKKSISVSIEFDTYIYYPDAAACRNKYVAWQSCLYLELMNYTHRSREVHIDVSTDCSNSSIIVSNESYPSRKPTYELQVAGQRSSHIGFDARVMPCYYISVYVDLIIKYKRRGVSWNMVALIVYCLGIYSSAFNVYQRR